jgi:signal transduction histidine kinase
MITAADLRRMDLFDDLDDAALAEFVALAQERTAAPGDVIIGQGQVPDGVQLLLEGTAMSTMLEGGREEPVGRQQAPTWMGAIAVLTERPLPVRITVATDARLAVIPPEEFRRLAFTHPAVQGRVMRQAAPVAMRITAVEQNRERMASLGTMAAGLAHELNNPAAAAQRASAQLSEALEVISSTMRRFVEAGVERSHAEILVGLQKEAMRGAKERTALDALDAADAEDELMDRLGELGVEEAWQLAEPLAAAGVDQAWLDRVHEAAGPATGAALDWVGATLTARGLAAELQESTRRMSDLVGAVKSYAYMDRGAQVEVDLHEGLETTLAVLGHKLKHTSIEVSRDYDRSLPRMTVHGSELNQVWTNLIDNAIDAVGESGTIAVRTHLDGNCAVVEVADDGPGIPPEARDHVFDSFYTTKDVGAGTGLGLATARRIVVERHDGSLTFDSAPGRTVFSVRLPIPA